MPTTADAGSNMLNALARILAGLALAVGAALALVFAFAAAAVVGLMIAGAALALRFAPRQAVAGGPDILEAQRTPNGWVVEAGARRKS
jgi:hypothetical protein